MTLRLVFTAIFGAALVCAQAAAPAIPSYKQLKFPPLKAVQVPEPVTFTLPNGMKVFLLENHELPLVSGNALVRTGNLFDPSDKRGLADFTGQVIRSGGTAAKTGDEIDAELENMAASVEAQIGESSGGVSFSCLKENSGKVMAIFKEILTAPEFRADKLEFAVQQQRSAISRRNDDAGGIAQREFANTIYGKDNSYGWSIEYEHIDRIKRADVQAFYRRYFFPANVRLSVYGDFNAAEMRGQLEKLFADWTVKQQPVPAFPAVKQQTPKGVFLAERDDVTQTFFEIGHIGGLLKDADYAALQVAGTILGSGFSSRLMTTVRTKLGYAYSIGGGWGAGFESPGLFQISGSTKSSTTVDTIRVVREEVEKLRTQLVTGEELQTAKESTRNSFVFNFDRPSKTLNRMVLYEYFGYPKDFMFQYQQAVQKVTKEDVLRVAKAHWRTADFTIVAVGNPKEFGKPLDDLKLPVRKIDLTIPDPPKEAASAASPESLARGAELAAKARQAMGGGPLALVKSFDVDREMELQNGGASLKISQTMRVVYPNYLRQDQKLPFGKVVVYSDTKTGWMVGPQGNIPMQPAVLDQVRGELFRTPFLLLTPSPGKQFNAVSADTIQITGADGNTAKLTVGPDGLPQKLSYMSTAMTGGASEVVETFSDWREVSGIQLPFKTAIEQGGKKYADMTVLAYRLNTGVNPEELAKKPQ
jgi:zinc protease